MKIKHSEITKPIDLLEPTVIEFNNTQIKLPGSLKIEPNHPGTFFIQPLNDKSGEYLFWGVLIFGGAFLSSNGELTCFLAKEVELFSDQLGYEKVMVERGKEIKIASDGRMSCEVYIGQPDGSVSKNKILLYRDLKSNPIKNDF
jgi:hypothetical protein